MRKTKIIPILLFTLSSPLWSATTDTQSQTRSEQAHLALKNYHETLLIHGDVNAARALLAPDVVYIDNLKDQKFVGVEATYQHIRKVAEAHQKIIKFGAPKMINATATETDLVSCECFKKAILITRTVTVNDEGKIIRIEVSASKKDKSKVKSLPGEKP